MRKLLYLTVALAGCTNFSALSRDYGDLGEDAAAPTEDLARTDGPESVLDMEHDGSAGPSCTDERQDGNETDVDCGGSCGPCDVGHLCVVDADCQTGTCIEGSCELAFGPPSWLQVGTAATGNNPPIARLDLQMGIGGDGALYAMGGRTSSTSNSTLNTVERLDPSGTWGTSNSLNHARADFAVISGGADRFLWALYGDNNGNGNAENTVEVMFANMVPSFTSLGNDMDTRVGCAGTLGPDQKVYIVGGNSGGTSSSILASATVYTENTQSFVALPSLTTAREFHGVAVGGDQRIYAIGGTGPNGTLTSVEALSVAGTAWSAAAPLPSARSSVPAVLAPDGRIYVAGGVAPELGQIYLSTVAYRAATATLADRWVPAADLLAPRFRHGVAVGADGRIYVVGGSSFSAPLRTTEAYGPIVTLSAASGAAGSTLSVSGSNFATSAAVKITIAGPGGTTIGTGITDTTGALAAVNVMIPAGTTAGPTRIFATDARSRYPVSGAFTVTP